MCYNICTTYHILIKVIYIWVCNIFLEALMENNSTMQETKFCKECGQKIAKKAVICPLCGCQVEEMARNEAPQQIVINNTNQNSNQNTNNNTNANIGFIPGVRVRNKWVSLALCICAGYFGAHKFYEGKNAAGVLYLCTCGLFFVGVVLDAIALLGKPNPYVVV